MVSVGGAWACGIVDCVETEAIELSKVLEVVGVIGLVAWLEEGESLGPDDSFVRFFLRNPSVGI